MRQTASIIICTQNRAASLKETLEAIGKISIPFGTQNELLVIDNGSVDDTADVVRLNLNSQVDTRYIYEPSRGLSYARNHGLLEAQGELIIFIDDDVRPSKDWLVNIFRCFNERKVDAVAGKVILPSELLKPWMTALHRKRLASTEGIDPEKPAELVGANMAFVRHVLGKVPQFDTELGAGASGFGEESLFSRQLLQAGYQFAFAGDAPVEHFFNEKRMSRVEWLKSAVKRGATKAYISHHWEHEEIIKPLYGYLKALLSLYSWRGGHLDACWLADGCAMEEMQLVKKASFLKHYMIEKKRPRNYEYHGLVKIH